MSAPGSCFPKIPNVNMGPKMSQSYVKCHPQTMGPWFLEVFNVF